MIHIRSNYRVCSQPLGIWGDDFHITAPSVQSNSSAPALFLKEMEAQCQSGIGQQQLRLQPKSVGRERHLQLINHNYSAVTNLFGISFLKLPSVLAKDGEESQLRLMKD